MAQTFDPTSGRVVASLDEDTATKVGIPKAVVDSDNIPMLDPTGKAVWVGKAKLDEAVKRGFVYESPQQETERKQKEKYQGGTEALKAFGESAASAATFGLSRAAESALGVDPEAMAARKKFNPSAATAGSVAGIVGPLLAPEAGLLGLASAPVKGVAKLGMATTEAALPAAKALASKVAKPGSFAEAVLAGAGSTAAGSAVEGAAYGLGQSIDEAALGDPEMTAEKVISNMGLSAFLAGGMGGLLGAAGGGVGSVLGKRAASAAADEAAVVRKTAEGVTQPAESLGELRAQVKGAKYKSPGEALPQLAELDDALTRVTDLEMPVNPMQREALQSQEAYDFVRSMKETHEALGPLLNEAEAIQKRELVGKLSAAPEALAPGYRATTDAVESAGRLFKVAEKQVKAEQAELSPLFKRFDDLAVQGISSPIELVESLGRAVPKAEKFIQVIPREGEGALYKLAPYNADMGVSRKIYGALQDVLDAANRPNQTIAGIRNTRESIRGLVGKVDDGAELAQIGAIRRELMDYVGNQIQKAAPDMQVRDIFRRYAVNEEKRTVLESIFGGSLSDKATFAKSAVPEKVLDRIFSDSVNVNAVKELLGPPEFNKVMADYLARKIQSSTDLGTFRSGEFARFLKGKEDVLAEALSDNPIAHQRMKDLVTIMRVLPDAPKVNPSGTAKTLNILSKVKEFGSLFEGGIGGIPNQISKRIAQQAERVQAEMTANQLLAGKKFEDAQAMRQFDAIRKLEKAAEKTANAVSTSVKALFDASKKVHPAAAGAVVPAASAKDKKDSKDRHSSLRELNSNPEKMIELMESSTRSLYSNAPKTSSSLQASAIRATQFLASKLPPEPTPFPLSKPLPMPQADIAKFQRYSEVVENPLSVFSQIKDGTITPEAVETIGVVYPKLYNEIKTQIVSEMTDAVTKEVEIPYATRMSLSLFLGQPLDATFTPEAIQAAQPKPPAPSPQQQAAGPKPGGSMKALQKTASLAMTPGQARMADRATDS